IAHDPIVEIRDDQGRPIEGAAVTFFLGSQGPGGTFANGANTQTVTTGRSGQATARGIHLNPQPGPFEIRVTASYQGQTVTEMIRQRNVAGISTSHATGLSGKAWLILGLAGAGIAGGVIAAKHGGSSGPSGPIVITP